MGSTKKRLVLPCCAASAALFLVPDRTVAQASEPDHPANALQEVVVTAEKREERLQNVPITVSAFTAQTAQSMGIRDTLDLSQAVPGLAMYPQNVQMSPYIRGIGNKNTSVGDEAAVALYVDGVYISSMAAGMFSLNNIERIEVLKGPQGTLFGRNATAGVIQIITRMPQQTPSMHFRAGYGNYDTVEASFYGTTGITDNLAADLAVYEIHQGEGWGRDLFTGRDIFLGHEFAARSKWRLIVGDRTDITLAVDYDRTVPVVPPAFTTYLGHKFTGGVTIPGFYNTDSNIDVAGDSKQAGVNLQIQHDLSWARVVSISSYRDVNSVYTIDNDATPALLQQARLTQPARTWTQELQLASAAESSIKWILGGYYFNDDAKYDPLDLQVKTTSISIHSEQASRSYAAFSQATAPVLANTNLTVGLRYTIDDRHITGQQFINGGSISPFHADQSARFNKTTWRVALDHHFTEDILGYIQDSRGFKSGVFNTVAPTGAVVRPEVVDNYEIGLKSEFLQRRLRVNGAAFFNNVKDIQLQVSVPGGTALLNAAQAHIGGVDLDLEAVPVENLDLRAGLEYLNSRYTDFRNAAFFNPLPAGGNVQVVGNATGNTLINAPRWTANLGVKYTIPSAVGDFTLDVADYYNAGFVFDQQARLQQPKYNLVNASIGWQAKKGTWGIRLWAKNLTDREYYSNIIPQVYGDTATPAAPRTFGATLDVHLR